MRLETWKKTAALLRSGAIGGSADREAQSRSQYFLFRGQVEQALTDLYRAENRLRYIMGLSMSDGRLIRPSDEPTTARVAFDWSGIHCEAITRRVEIRKEKWEIKRRELELIAARNMMLPRLDAVGRYRWLGLGDDLIGDAAASSTATSIRHGLDAPSACLTSGEFQEWQLGLQLSMPIGFRRELSGVRHHELLIARERAMLQDLELEISHQLGDSIRDVDNYYGLSQTNFNRRVASEKEVQAVDAAYEADRVTLDLLLDAQRRRAEAESAYYRSLIDYNKAIMNVHYRKGSLLDYNGVYLAEGPWPGKAYFDALREARKRDASMYLDYGFTRPNVISQGPYQQLTGEGCETEGCGRRRAGDGSGAGADERSDRDAADACHRSRPRRRGNRGNSVSQSGVAAPREAAPKLPATTSRVHSMNVKRITRLLKLLQLLQSGSGQNADGLAKACGVSRRTAFRDIEALAGGRRADRVRRGSRSLFDSRHLLPAADQFHAGRSDLAGGAGERNGPQRPAAILRAGARRRAQARRQPARRAARAAAADHAGDSHPADARQPAGGQGGASISSWSTPEPNGRWSASSTTASPNGSRSKRSSGPTTCCFADTAGT